MSELLKEMARAPKGLPRIRVSNGRLQIMQTYQGKKYCISLGLPDSPSARKRAERLRALVETDVIEGRFDTSLKAYYERTNNVQRSKGGDQPKHLTDLMEVWDAYETFKTPHVEQTTIDIWYANVRSHISKLPSSKLSKAKDIRDYLAATCSADTAQRILTAFNGACRWAYESELIELNPFEKLKSSVKGKKNESKEEIDPFYSWEVPIIIKAFEESEKYSFYAPFVKFLFLTGCRTSEAIALEWDRDISEDCTQITFTKALVQSSKGQTLKGLKSQEKRVFPCNAAITELLQSQKAKALETGCKLVFTGHLPGKYIDRSYFTGSAK